ncbi:MAG: hypothetical protein KAU02_00860 [Tenericutes bacterium]|nr:hypothetical protein [Mycoplasmatota bacterium]
MKLLKKLIIIIVVLAIFLIAGSLLFLNQIQYEVTSDDLPQDVYETSGELLPYAKTKVLGLLTANEDDRYTLIEEIINLIILDSIQENINENYDPLGDCTTNTCLKIYDSDSFYIDYIYAEINEDNQIEITISAGSESIVKVDTALILVLDIEFNIITLNPNVVFTLNSYYLGNKGLSLTLLNIIFNRFDKTEVEDSMTFGILDLDEYTYTISITDAIT